MGRFTPCKLELMVTAEQLCVLEDIHECVEYVSKRLNRCLAQSFAKNGIDYINRMIELTESLEFEWKLWVLQDFKAKMNSVEFFKGVGIQRINPFGYESRDD